MPTRPACALDDAQVRRQPSLRSQGSLRGMLEEIAEAALFEAWLGGGGGNAGGVGGGEGAVGGGGGEGGQERVLLLHGDAALLGDELAPSEYLGGVCDLVGEIGRFAVRRATERDAHAVREALATAVAVQTAMLTLGSNAPRGLNKKGDALRTAVSREP